MREVKPNTLFGEGQVQRIATDCELHEAELVIVDGALSPIQQRNLEDKIGRKVIDRTGLILEIFGERAATAEGRLQVELAHLDYQASRLVRSWTHLERQRGGLGFVGGPGETQIEADRRAIDDQLVRLRRQLEKVVKTRALHRAARAKVPFPIVALVGYTNAGKSTLFNRLTGAEVMAKDMLFATLDPTMRSLVLPDGPEIILSDTVGFISDLPTELVAAFRATLEEVLDADLIVHVRDISHPETEVQARDVEAILEALGVDDDITRLEAHLAVETQNNPELGKLFLDAGPRRLHNVLTELLDRAAAQGTLAIEDTQLAAEYFAGMVKGLADLERRFLQRHPDHEQHTRKRIEGAVDLFLKGSSPG